MKKADIHIGKTYAVSASRTNYAWDKDKTTLKALVISGPEWMERGFNVEVLLQEVPRQGRSGMREVGGYFTDLGYGAFLQPWDEYQAEQDEKKRKAEENLERQRKIWIRQDELKQEYWAPLIEALDKVPFFDRDYRGDLYRSDRHKTLGESVEEIIVHGSSSSYTMRTPAVEIIARILQKVDTEIIEEAVRETIKADHYDRLNKEL